MDEGLMTLEITGRTRVFVVLAHPTDHVRSPQLFNRTAARERIDLVTIAVDVEPEHLGRVVTGLRPWRNLVGMGITVPHKEAIVPFLDRLDGQASVIGAVNCVRREPDGSLTGATFDGVAMVEALRCAGSDPAGKRVQLIGAGGAARAIAFAIAAAGASALRIENRSAMRASRLAGDVSLAYPLIHTVVGSLGDARPDIVINATTLGMHAADALPLDSELLRPEMTIADAVMVDQTTKLLEAAAASGCTIVRGQEMLDAQVTANLAFVGFR